MTAVSAKSAQATQQPTLIDNVIDSIESPQTTGQPIQDVVHKATALLGYSGGNSWPTFHPFEAARPDLAKKGWVVPVTLSCTQWGRCYDIEDHGGTNGNIGVFMHNYVHVWKLVPVFGLPWLYTFASNYAAMVSAAIGFGFHPGHDFYTLIAHPGTRAGKHICSPHTCGEPFTSDGTQWDFAGSYDASILNDYMLPHAAPKPPSPYAIFPTDIGDKSFPNRGNERLTVEQIDGALEHAAKFHGYLKGPLRHDAKEFRDRIWRVARYEPPHFVKLRPHPVWAQNHLGQRWQGLNNRIKRIDAIK